MKMKLLAFVAATAFTVGFSSNANAEEIEVKAGDTLWDIANEEGITVDTLIKWNNLDDSHYIIHPNDTLLLHEIHVVEEGESLWDLAKEYNVSVDDLVQWNMLESDTIQPGSELIIKSDRDDKQIEDDSKNVSTVAQASTEVKTASTGQASESKSTAKELTVTATAYTASCEGCSGTTAIGINLLENPNQKVIAVDPNVIPLGSTVHVEGYGEAVAGDTGGAIKGNKIDLFMPSKSDAINFGRKEVKVTIID
ncbi:LysM peptidoglycan-binding domain-containing protein [Metabacillus sp. HB246100]